MGMSTMLMIFALEMENDGETQECHGKVDKYRMPVGDDFKHLFTLNILHFRFDQMLI
jgi:hypothetical protein